MRNADAEQFFLTRFARDEVGTAFIESLGRLGEYEVRGDLRIYRSPYAVTADVVFSGASGMADTFWRLDPEDHAIALACGAEQAEIGAEWVRITLFRANWPKPDLDHWALRAYVFARSAK
jgi:hypothetical protein